MEIKEKNLGKVCVTVDGDWSVSRDYDKLCIVYNGETNASYISKKYIPKGIDIKDSEYWQRFTKPVEINVEDIDVDIRYKLPFNVGNSSGNFNINQSQYNDILQAASEGKLIEVNNVALSISPILEYFIVDDGVCFLYSLTVNNLEDEVTPTMYYFTIYVKSNKTVEYKYFEKKLVTDLVLENAIEEIETTIEEVKTKLENKIITEDKVKEIVNYDKNCKINYDGSVIRFSNDHVTSAFAKVDDMLYTIREELENSVIIDFDALGYAENIGVFTPEIHEALIEAYNKGKRIFFKSSIIDGGSTAQLEVKYSHEDDGYYYWYNQRIYSDHLSFTIFSIDKSNYDVNLSSREINF